MINPYYIASPKDAFDKRGVKYKFARGYDADNADGGGKLLEEAVRAAAGFDKVVVFAGLTDYAEFEGGDRESLALPKNQLALIDGLTGAGKRVVAVLFGGAVTELPFAEGVGAILNMNLSGQNCGTATSARAGGLRRAGLNVMRTCRSAGNFQGRRTRYIRRVYLWGTDTILPRRRGCPFRSASGCRIRALNTGK